jgi:hypothetical protein
LALNPNIRLVDNTPTEEKASSPVQVHIPDDTPKDVEEMDDSGNVIRIKHPDGSITVSLGGRPLKSAQRAKSEGWYKNLCDDIDPAELTRIGEELLTGIADDEQSRTEWTETVAEGVKLLGIKLEPPGNGASSDGAPVEGMSKVRHPLLLEAVLRFQANARGEFLPVDGPIKMRDDSNNATSDEDQLANYFQKDLNHFLTVVAEEYYPDTDRMFLKLGFQGLTFKKVYYCPLRSRPVSETVEAKDLIVNEEAKTLQSAARITHRIMMKKSTFRRMQLLGVYRDIDLGVPQQPKANAIDAAEKETQGVRKSGMRQEERDREIFECYCELNIRGFEHKWRNKDSGLDVPYRVTIDVSSRTILSICRDYKRDDKKLPERRKTFVPYLFVPGLGFYGMGLLHILGNSTNALTASWREMLDNGMFANFPGFLYSKPAGRQTTLNFRVPPGGGAPFDTNGADIRTAIMALPYNTQHMAPLMQLTDSIAQSGMRLGGAAEQPVEEGRGVQPVGTTLALIEQAQKVLNSVHKRVHSAQQLEFQLLVDVFRDYPDSFWECNDEPSYQWDQETFERALSNCNFVPVADPNTASQGQRIMKVMGLKLAQKEAPEQYDARAVEETVVQTLGFSNWERFLKPISQVGQPPPEMLREKAELDIKKQDADTRRMKAQGDLANAQQKQGLEGAALQLDAKNAETEQGLGAIKAKSELGMHAAELKSKADDRLMELRKQVIDIAQNVAVHPESAELVNPVVQEAFHDLKQRESAQGLSFGDLGGMTK